MDLNSWTPEDNARRYAIMAASSFGAFVGIAVWLGAEQHPLIGLLAGFAAGFIIFYPLRWVLRRIYEH